MIVGVCAYCACLAAGRHALASDLPTASTQESDWSGFDPAFHPNWNGNEKMINWTPPPQPSYLGSVSCVNIMNHSWLNYIQFAQPKPIALLSSSRTTTSHATTSVSAGSQSVSVDTPGGNSISTSGDWNWQSADYARVVNQNHVIMGESRSIGDLDSNISDDHLSATGRVQATTSLEQSLIAASSTKAVGGASLAADYEVNVPVSFTLGGTLSGGGDVGLKFSLVNDATGKSIYELAPSTDPVTGHSWSFDLAGQLDRGGYSIKISAATDAGVSAASGTDLGGAGEYKLDFAAKALEESVPPPPADALAATASKSGLTAPTGIVGGAVLNLANLALPTVSLATGNVYVLSAGAASTGTFNLPTSTGALEILPSSGVVSSQASTYPLLNSTIYPSQLLTLNGRASTASDGNVPEPSTLLLATLIAAALIAQRGFRQRELRV
jgi:hypothetical protein